MPAIKEAVNTSKSLQSLTTHYSAIRQSQMNSSRRSIINFECLPILVLRRIMSYLDIGHIVPLTRVNRRLRCLLTEDNGYWLFLLHSRLNVKLTGKNRNTAFAEFVKRFPTLQCAECHRMQLPRRPFIDPFWNRSLCDVCRFDDKYRIVTSYTAKHNYFLNEDDLLSLRTFSRKNHVYPDAAHTRLFSRFDVQQQSNRKLRRLGITRKDRLAKRNIRSQRAKDRWRKQVEDRLRHVTHLLAANGFPNGHYCTAVDGYIRNRWRNRGTQERWTAQSVLRECCAEHPGNNQTENI
jgi:hypothetical protein